MIVGSTKRISLSTSSFEDIISKGHLYVDKTRMIEHFLEEASEVQLISRQRRLGKSLNMDMLRCFLTDGVDYRHLFNGLYIEKSHVWGKAHSAPVFYFDFKSLRLESYHKQIMCQVDKYIYSLVDPDELKGYFKRMYQNIMGDPVRAADSLHYLTELTFEVTGKRSYILIDEYDKLLMDNYNSDKYDEIRKFETALLSSALKGNKYLEKALLTGVMRISHESMLSGLNNVETHDVFSDCVYTEDYGFTDEEILKLNQLCEFDIAELKAWYNGIKINGCAIYNTYSVMSFIKKKFFDCYWGKSGAMDIIVGLLNDERKLVVAKLLNKEQAEVAVDSRISLKRLSNAAGDEAFYSLLVQAGYLSIDEKLSDQSTSFLTIPNKELLVVWKEFILKSLYSGVVRVKTLFDNVSNLNIFADDLEYFLKDRLSYHDLAVYEGESKTKTYERIYHIFLLGILSAYEDTRCHYPISNRESGDGRYDILVEKFNSYFIFECKACEKESELDKEARSALAQIDIKRYGVDLRNDKQLVKIGLAFYRKLCKVKCG